MEACIQEKEEEKISPAFSRRSRQREAGHMLVSVFRRLCAEIQFAARGRLMTIDASFLSPLSLISPSP